MLAQAVPLTWNEALSGITGTISLAAWIFLLLPQLYENYANGHADGISLAFLIIWFLGDVTNLAGAVWAGLVPTVVALAVYFCAADAVMLGQCFYYRVVNRERKSGEGGERGGKSHGHVVEGEETPLLSDGHGHGHATKRPSFTDVTDANLGLPGSHHRSLSTASRTSHSHPTNPAHLSAIPETSPPSRQRTVLKNSAAVLAILLAGTAAWAIAYKTGAWTPTPPPSSHHHHGTPTSTTPTPLGAELLGYVSAVCYLGARIPQIVRNQVRRSCEGLSLLFFLLSVMGNVTYGMGILFHSVEREYFLTNLPWLIGSLGTVAEDLVIFAQFRAFGSDESHPNHSPMEDGEAAVE